MVASRWCLGGHGMLPTIVSRRLVGVAKVVPASGKVVAVNDLLTIAARWSCLCGSASRCVESAVWSCRSSFRSLRWCWEWTSCGCWVG